MRRFIHMLIILPLFCQGPVLAQSARQYFKDGEDFYRSMNFIDAIDQFSKAIEQNPDFEKAYVNRALSYSKTGDHQKAARDFDRAIVLNGRDPELFYFSGNEWHIEGKNDLALARLNMAISLKGNFLEAYQVRFAVNMELGNYDEALYDTKRSLKLNEDERGYYNQAQVYEKLELYNEAEQAYIHAIDKNGRIAATYYSLALLQLNRMKISEAITSINNFLELEPKNLDGLLLLSQIMAAQGNYPKSIEILSMASVDYPDEARIFIDRGDINALMNQASYSIIDYSKALEIDPENREVYYKRAEAYESIRDYEKALADYEVLRTLSNNDGTAQKLHEQATLRIYELNREEDKPRVRLQDPLSTEGNRVDIPREIGVINIAGIVEDQSDIRSLQVNGFSVPVEKTREGYRFMASVNLSNSERITIQVVDIYENAETAIFLIRRTEVDPPTVQMIAPYSSENNILYIDSDDPQIFLEGKVGDESLISSIYVESVLASYIPSDLNPSFSALVNIENKSRILVQVEDEFGNKTETTYTLNRDAQAFGDNPMGKTWVVFVENSDYMSYASLNGPAKDITMMKAALSRYQVNNFIHKKNMTKMELQRFFSIELRDMLKSNRVTSLLVWYAGHGTYFNESGYWIPVDAVQEDEFTYYNINALKASMQSYPDFLSHTLVVTDACESGPTFFQAMRSGLQVRDCNDWESTKFKSSQVFSSAGYELAADDSQFTRTFANVLINNPNDCLPIETVVQKVTSSVVNNNQQQPQFGKIAGLEDENGTFFFIPKDY